MARIIVPASTLIGRQLLNLNAQIINASNSANRLFAIASQIANNGAAKQNLESSAESLMPVGTGAAVYDGIASIKASLDSLAALVSSIDQG